MYMSKVRVSRVSALQPDRGKKTCLVYLHSSTLVRAFRVSGFANFNESMGNLYLLYYELAFERAFIPLYKIIVNCRKRYCAVCLFRLVSQ